jgi:hypothetical protein
MINLQIISFCFLAVLILAMSIKNLNKWAAALQRGYSRDIKKAFGEESPETPSLLICKIHVIFLTLLALVIVFYFCFGTIYS